MSNHVYKLLELHRIVHHDDRGCRLRNAIAKAGKTMRNMHWFQVMETRGQIVDGKVAYWQITLKIGFTLDD